MDIEHEFKQKMHVDVLFDTSMLKVLIPIVTATLILYVMCFQSPECRILIYLIWYASFVILLLKERTMVEVTPHMIIIQRPLFHPLIIDKRSITDVQVKKNTNNIVRWSTFIILLILTGYLTYEAFYDVVHSISGTTLASGILLIMYEFWIVFLLAVLLMGIWKKIPYSNLLKVNTDKSYFIFYSQETEELKKKIEEQDTA